MTQGQGLRAPSAGFTLLEVLVALAIVSAVAVLSWQGLGNVIRLTQRVTTLDEQWDQMRVAFGQLEKDFKQVANPRNAPGAPGQPIESRTPRTASEAAPGATGDPNDRLTMLRSESRADVIVENDERLDQVVNNLTATLRKVQIQGNTLILLTQTSNRRDGPTTQTISWRLDNGRLRRQQDLLGASSLDASGAPRPSSIAPLTVFDEPGLAVRGVGVRLWIEGRGWGAEQNLGEPLPPAEVFAPPADSTSPANPANPQAPAGLGSVEQTVRYKGAWVRVWLPSGEVYSRVFMLGQSS